MYNQKQRNNENFEYCKRVVEELRQYIDGEITNDDGDQLNIYDYMSDILDFNIMLDSRLEYTACKVYVALGGPTVWIDTYTGTVEIRWANESASYYLDYDIIDEINDYFEEFYNCR